LKGGREIADVNFMSSFSDKSIPLIEIDFATSVVGKNVKFNEFRMT
jgi:hypothetical protein